MRIDSSRRDFLKLTLAAASASPFLNVTAGQPAFGTTPIPNPKFYWGIGIENCWMAQTDPKKDGNRRLLDVFLQMRHYDHWKRDLDLLPATGVNAIRYSVPWYKAEPRPGVYDWSWIDGPVEYLVSKLRIIPIMDLIHYGTPAWMPDGVADERFPEAIGKYAGAMAVHFRGLVNHYTPHNEPGLTCLFCGLEGRWPPYRKSWDAWAQIGASVAKGMILEMNAIRSAVADAVIVSVDPWFGGVDVPKEDPGFEAIQLASSCYPASTAFGKVDAKHPFWAWLVKHGVKEPDIEWIFKHAAKPDILGYNYYPDFGFGWGNDPKDRTRDFTRGGTVSVTRGASEAAARLTDGLKRAQAYFELPVYLTETSAGLSVEARIGFINALGDWAHQMRSERVPLVGVNWWPLFDTIQWDYREESGRPLADFVYEGGWNNGLYRIEPQADGELNRVSTPAVSAFREMVARDRARH